MSDTLKFRKGVASALPATSNGQILFTTDTNELYIDDAGSHKQINAKNAKSADKLNTNAGDSNTPVYFSNGKPVACTGLDLDTSGNAATATTAASCSGNAATSTVSTRSQHLETWYTDKSQTYGSSYPLYAWWETSSECRLKVDGYKVKVDSADSCTGNSATATALTSNAGSSSLPIYFSGGKPVACGTSLAVSITGNAATATKLATARTISLTGDVTGSGSFDGSGNLSIAATVADNSHNHTNYLPLAGGTMTGALTFKNTTATPAKGTILNCIQGQYQNAAGNYYTIGLVDLVASAETGTTVSSGYARYGSSNGSSFFTAGESGRTMPAALATAGALGAENAYIMADGTIEMYAGCANDAATYTKAMSIASSKVTSHVALYGAVWNDYAEYRAQKEEIKPGYCVASADNGQVYKTTEKFQACDGIVSDTFGFAIGETDECKTPLAVAGRVLAYCEGDRYSYHSGDTVCAGPDGKVVKMTREEIHEWPDRIIGIVSEIPEYETWGSGNVAVNNRIWIKIK